MVKIIAKNRMIRAVFGFFMILSLFAACSKKEVILPGERIAIVDQSTISNLQIDQQAADEGAQLPAISSNLRFDTPGLSAGHRGGHLGVEFPLSLLFETDVGVTAEIGTEMAQPVVNGEAVFTITPQGLITATSVVDGVRLWQVDIDNSTDTTQPSISGGMSLFEDTLFVHGGKNKLFALNVETGVEKWSADFTHFLLGGPSVARGLVIVTDVNGRVYALLSATGEELWNRIGAPDATGIIGASFPAIAENEVIIAGSDGDLTSLNLEQGGFNWGESLVPVRPVTSLDTIADITAHPIHDGGLIVAVTQSGVMVAFNARTGRIIWEQVLSAVSMPWLAGQTIFITTVNNQLYALRRADGAVRWKTDLPGVFPANRPATEDTVRYTGPVVVSGKVVLAGRDRLYIFNAQTGAQESTLRTGEAITTALSVAGGKIYALGRKGTLMAWH